MVPIVKAGCQLLSLWPRFLSNTLDTRYQLVYYYHKTLKYVSCSGKAKKLKALNIENEQ